MPLKLRLLMTALLISFCGLAGAQTISIGVINTYSGPFATFGDLIEKGMRLYMKQNERNLPAGVKVELLTRDDGGPSPDKAKQLAQELIVRNGVQFLTGVVWTPNAMAIGALATEAKVPFVVTNAAGSALTTTSPYIARVSLTLWQTCYPLGQWAAKQYKRAYIIVSDYSPGHDAEAAFEKGFTERGGIIVGKVRVPVVTNDFAPFLQRAKDAKPDALFSFVASGKTATQLIKTYAELGLDKAGVKFMGPGDVLTDEELPSMGDAALGAISGHNYSTSGNRPANKAFLDAWHKEYGEKSTPSGMSVSAWDSMDAIYYAIREQKGKVDGQRTMELLKQYKNPNSPRGPISIDPETRDIIQNVYIREVRKVNGQLANVEMETIPNTKDYWKEFNAKK